MKKENMQRLSNAGNVEFELKEIKEMQKNADSYLSLLTNTCSPLYTVFCC